MDPILQILLSWQFILFGLAVAALVYVLRIVVEYVLISFNIDPKIPKWWNDLVLPVLPVVLGPMCSIFIKTFPYPDGLITVGSRLIFGLVAGLLSTLLYRIVKALLSQKLQSLGQAADDTTTNQPPSTPPRGTM